MVMSTRTEGESLGFDGVCNHSRLQAGFTAKNGKNAKNFLAFFAFLAVKKSVDVLGTL